jgi:hypothetical protein
LTSTWGVKGEYVNGQVIQITSLDLGVFTKVIPEAHQGLFRLLSEEVI